MVRKTKAVSNKKKQGCKILTIKMFPVNVYFPGRHICQRLKRYPVVANNFTSCILYIIWLNNEDNFSHTKKNNERRTASNNLRTSTDE
jgi:hypothetical protein